MFSAAFDFYGYRILVESADEETISNIRRDFSFFLSSTANPQLSISVYPETADYKTLPRVRPSLHSPRNFCYRDHGLLLIDYFGKALSTYDEKKREYSIYCEDAHVRHEVVFLTILSAVGKNLDQRHLHRVHGLALKIYGQSILVLLPQGGGKTTLLLDLLKENDVHLLSEDTPILDTQGYMLPFPIRIGIDAGKKPDFPGQHLRFINRMEFGPKYLLDVDYFKGRVVTGRCKPSFIFRGVRCLGVGADILPASRLSTLKTFIENSVIGLGVYQGIEFLLQHNALELFKKSGIAASRLRNSLAAISNAQTFDFFTGCDIEKNSRAILEFLKKNC
ncbi:MAG: hypothetical protein KBA46_03395 [Candidatus Omnitrophica bacterium]|nr:hypothetical protein [Candidatus Omnitrophota bacterium]